MSAHTTHLPFDISIEKNSSGSIELSSNLVLQFIEDQDRPAGPFAKASADAIESFLMAMAGEGFDMTDSRLWRALETSVEAIANNMGEEPTTKIAVILDGGLVHEVIGDGDVEVYVVDKDIEGSSDYIEYEDESGLTEEACISQHSVEINPVLVSNVCEALNKEGL